VGGERKARIRIKDFTPDPYADEAAVTSAGFVDAAYMAKVTGIAFESAATIDRTKFTFKLKRIIVHGGVSVDTKLRSGLLRGVTTRIREVGQRAKGVTPAAKWPRHHEMH